MENKTIVLTPAHVQKIFNLGSNSATEWHAVLWPAMQKYQITNLLRASMFFGNLAVESSNLTVLKENLNYSAEGLMKTFPSRFPTAAIANQYARKPEAIANRAYANKIGNGNEASGDGWRYAGKGAIQLTGKENYLNCSRGEIDCRGDKASVLLTKDGAARSACWFWGSKGINRLADAGGWAAAVRRVNAKALHMEQRTAAYKKAIKVLSGDPTLEDIPDSDVEVDPSNTGSTSNQSTPDSKISGISEPTGRAAPEYPHNKVYQSPSGHLIEIDDTPGAERLHLYHMSGSYIEMFENGDIVIKAHQDLYLLAGGEVKQLQKNNKAEIVEGQSYEKTQEKIMSTDNMTIEAKDMQVNSPSSFAQPMNAKQIDVEELTCTAEVAQLKAAGAVLADVASALAPGSSQGAALGGLSNSIKFEVPEGTPEGQNPANQLIQMSGILNPSGMVIPKLTEMPSTYQGIFVLDQGGVMSLVVGFGDSFFTLSNQPVTPGGG